MGPEELLTRLRDEARSLADQAVGTAQDAVGTAQDAAGQAVGTLDGLRREAEALVASAAGAGQERLEELGSLIGEVLDRARETGDRVTDDLADTIRRAANALADGADAAASRLPEPDSLREAIDDLTARLRR